MPRKMDLAPKKRPRQRRAVATVEALVEAATYILAREGLGGFTANKVAERAGVNIASFYQYFPNKEALIFHIVRKPGNGSWRGYRPSSLVPVPITR